LQSIGTDRENLAVRVNRHLPFDDLIPRVIITD
jgi:hypothetical protein